MAELLFELGSEELPARFVVPALDELERLGVARDEGEQVQLLRSGFVPDRALEASSLLLAQNLHDHAAAAVANVSGEGNFLEQAVYVDDIGSESAARLQRAAIAAWKQAFASVMAEAQARCEADAKALPAAQRDQRARFGVYFYSEREAAAAPAADERKTR